MIVTVRDILRMSVVWGIDRMLAFRLLLLVAIGVADVLSSPIQVSLQAPATSKPMDWIGSFRVLKS